MLSKNNNLLDRSSQINDIRSRAATGAFSRFRNIRIETWRLLSLLPTIPTQRQRTLGFSTLLLPSVYLPLFFTRNSQSWCVFPALQGPVFLLTTRMQGVPALFRWLSKKYPKISPSLSYSDRHMHLRLALHSFPSSGGRRNQSPRRKR